MIRSGGALYLSILASCTIFVAGCGGGGDGGGSSGSGGTSTLTGYFVDAPAVGVSWATSSGASGITGSDGSFSFKSGDTLTFSVLGVTLGKGVSVPSTGIVTPVTLSGESVPTGTAVTQTNAPIATAIAQFLQTLNVVSGNSTTTLVMPSGTSATSMQSALKSANATDPISAVNNLQSALNSSGITGVTVVSGSTALSHLNSTLSTGATWTIAGTINGLSAGTSVTLQDNGANNLSVTSNGSFVFSTAISNGGSYSVTVLTQPSGATCTVASGSGTASANVTGVSVSCATTPQSCPTVAGAATLQLNAGSTYHSFVVKTPYNANNVAYSSYAFDFMLNLPNTTSSAASVYVTDGKNSSVSVADLGAVCGLGGITAFPTKGQFSSVGTLSLQLGHGYFVEAPNGSYARLYISNVVAGSSVDIQYEHPSVICPPAGVTMTYDLVNGIETYNGVSVTSVNSLGGTVDNNGTVGSSDSTPFFGCNANATVQAWGAGGGGGGNYDYIGGAGGGGGGGGGYGTKSLALATGQYYLVTLGNGGYGGIGLDGANGTSSSFSTFSASDTSLTGTNIFVSVGGQGGKAPTSHTASGVGGTGGAGISNSGLSGSNGVPVATTPCVAGVSFGIGPGGAGGNAGGAGGLGASGGCTPGTAGIPGGGGAGASQNGAATDGAHGRVIISY